jgi:hypothetical protein
MKVKTGESKSQYMKRFVDEGGDEADAADAWNECQKNNEMKLNEEGTPVLRANSRHIEVRTLDSKLIRKAMFDGVEHLVCPMVMLTPGVRNNVLYTEKDMERHTDSWNGRPVVVFHPVNANGAPISAGKPEVFEQRRVGFVFNAKMEDGRLKAEAWIDPKRLSEVHAGCLETILAEKPLEISTGLFTDDEMAVNEADEKDQNKWPKHNDGKPYFAITRNYRPDHLALLPDKIGACSWADGAGLPRVNVWTEEARAASAEARRGGAGKESVTVDDLNTLYRSSESAASRVGTMLKDGITSDNVSQFTRAYETLTKEYGTARAWKDAMVRKAMTGDFAGSNRATVIATVSRLKEGLSTMPDLITRASMALSKARATARMNEACTYLQTNNRLSKENTQKVLNFLGEFTINSALVAAVSRLLPKGAQIIHTNTQSGMLRLCDASGVVRNVNVRELLHDNYGTSEGARAAWDTRGRGRKIEEEDRMLNRTYAQDHAQHREAALMAKAEVEDRGLDYSSKLARDHAVAREAALMAKMFAEDEELNKQWEKFVNEKDHVTGKLMRK